MSEDVANDPERVETGITGLDEMLSGGLPTQRSILLTGGPGTGKSTLAMEFLQAGLENDDRCLFLSTEQTKDELRSGFAPFPFDLDDSQLEIETLHAAPRKTREDEQEMVIRTLEGNAAVDEKEVPFTGENVVKYLDRLGDFDRIVFDSISGLEPVSESEETYRRTILDVIRTTSDQLEATTLLTAEHSGERPGANSAEGAGGTDAIQYSTHGVIRVWRESFGGDYQRFIDIMKMRGVDHDTRKFKLGLTEDGVDVYPKHRSQSDHFVQYERFQTGLAGLDDLLGGGLLQGTGTLLEHDGQASLEALFGAMLGGALNDEMALVIVPRIDMKPRRLETILYQADASVDELLDDDRLFVLDMVGAWGEDHRNVIDVMSNDAGLPHLSQQIRERAAGEGIFTMINTEAKIHAIGGEEARRIRDWQEAQYLGSDDVLLEVHNPNQIDDHLSEFHVDAAGQVLETSLDESGLQYLSLEKSPTGLLGSTRVLEFVDEEPFVRVRRA